EPIVEVPQADAPAPTELAAAEQSAVAIDPVPVAPSVAVEPPAHAAEAAATGQPDAVEPVAVEGDTAQALGAQTPPQAPAVEAAAAAAASEEAAPQPLQLDVAPGLFDRHELTPVAVATAEASPAEEAAEAVDSANSDAEGSGDDGAATRSA